MLNKIFFLLVIISVILSNSTCDDSGGDSGSSGAPVLNNTNNGNNNINNTNNSNNANNNNNNTSETNIQMGGGLQECQLNMEGVVKTFVNRPKRYSSEDGIGVTAGLDDPTAIATDGEFLYVSDGGNHTIRKIHIETGAVQTIAGLADEDGSVDGAGENARFDTPYGISTDGIVLYVADTFNHTIRKVIIESGEVTTVAGSAGETGFTDGTGNEARFDWPTTLTSDGEKLYITDFNNHAIRVLDMETLEVTTLAGTGFAGEVDSDEGDPQFDSPFGITIDVSGMLYVTDREGHTIRKVSSSTGEVSTFAGQKNSSGSTNGDVSVARFKKPRGITTDGYALYVADSDNHTIRKIDLATNVVTTLAGSPGQDGYVDGTGSSARFDTPYGIISDCTSLYIVDHENSTIRSIDGNGYEITSSGYFTGNELSCGYDLRDEILVVYDEVVALVGATLYEEYEDYVSNYDNPDADDENLEAYASLMISSVWDTQNPLLFTLAAIDSYRNNRDNPYYLNSVAMGLLIMDHIDLAGRVLDCAYEQDPSVFHTHENGAYFYAEKGMVTKALDSKATAHGLMPEMYPIAQDGYNYSYHQGNSTGMEYFNNYIPSNYHTPNADGTSGKMTPPPKCFFCDCNGEYYFNLTQCHLRCEVNLSCFTEVCKPTDDCGDNSDSPYVVGVSLCIPPTALQFCMGANSDRTMFIGLQLDGELGKVGVQWGYDLGNSTNQVNITVTQVAGPVGYTTSYDVLNNTMSRSYEIDTGIPGVGASMGIGSEVLWDQFRK